MTDDLLTNDHETDDLPQIQRLNKLPIYIAIAITVLVLSLIIYGVTTRGLLTTKQTQITSSGQSASNFADQLKAGIANGITQDPKDQITPPVQASLKTNKPDTPQINPFKPNPQTAHQAQAEAKNPELEKTWKDQLKREQQEQVLREEHRQRMQRIQANQAAFDSPTNVDISRLNKNPTNSDTASRNANSQSGLNRSDLYQAALKATSAGQISEDPNGQDAKQAFLDRNRSEAGYLDAEIVPQSSPYELKRGSVIPATLVTGINSDLPGFVTAQVRQNIYDTATGHHLLIPQGTKLLGRYDSEISFGQSRVLMVWTDLVFPDGSTLQLGGMAGTDAMGQAGFKDKVDRKYLQTFGSAILLAIIGTGIDQAVPQRSTLANQTTASDAARRNFAESFGRVAQQTIEKNLDIQPTLEIRPGYQFNVIIEKDLRLDRVR